MKITLAALALSFAVLAADDVAQKYGYAKDDFEAAVFSTLTSDSPELPYITPQLRSLSGAARVEAVKTLGVVIRAFVESKAFERRYDDYRKQHVSTPPVPPQDHSAMLKKNKAAMEAQRAQMEQSLQVLPADQRDAIRKSFNDAIASQGDAAGKADAHKAEEQARYANDKKRYDEANARLPKEPKEFVRRQLKRFVELTKGIDFDAKLVKNNYGQMIFAKPDYEAKPAEWKLAFRAGKEAVGAARTFAEKWLKALK